MAADTSREHVAITVHKVIRNGSGCCATNCCYVQQNDTKCCCLLGGVKAVSNNATQSVARRQILLPVEPIC